MRLVSRTRLLPAFVAVALALPATRRRAVDRRRAAPEPQPATDVALVASPARAARPQGHADGHRRAPRPRPHRARSQRFDEAAAALALGGPHHGRARRALHAPAGARARSAQRGSARRCSAAAPRRVTSASPEVAVRVFKPAMATWYGPGLYGNRPPAARRSRATSSASPTGRCRAARWSRSPTAARASSSR